MKSIESYKEEMMRLYRSVPQSAPADAIETQTQPMITPDTPQPSQTPPEFTPPQPAPEPLPPSTIPDGTGGLLVWVTTLRNLYAVPGAQVTVFKTQNGEREVIDTAASDESGRTKVFMLPAPPKNFSESAGGQVLPFALYSVEVKADGYVDSIILDVPVFSTITSIQTVDMMLRSAAENDNPQISGGANNYPL